MRGHKNGSSYGVDRREFCRAALAIGGASALSACLERERERGDSDWPGEPGYPQLEERKSRESRQHNWRPVLDRQDDGVPLDPRYNLVLLGNLNSSEPPTQSDKEVFLENFRLLDSTYPWSPEGLLYTVGYSPYYFDRFDRELEDVDLPEPEDLSPHDSPQLDRYDVSIHLASNYASLLLEAEEALKGNLEEVNDVETPEESLTSVLIVRERRTGFKGRGLPHGNQDVEGIPDDEPVPEESPLYMGFKSRHGVEPGHPDYQGEEPPVTIHNEATVERVTIQDGEFEGGTTQQVSNILLELDEWYEMDDEMRLKRMFDAVSSTSGLGGLGQNAQEAVRIPKEWGKDNAREHGIVGHNSKVARMREDETPEGLRNPLMIRKDFNSTDGGHSRLHFVSWQREISDFVKVREGMNGEDLIDEHEDIGSIENNGILEFISVQNRGNYLIPPVEEMVLPWV